MKTAQAGSANKSNAQDVLARLQRQQGEYSCDGLSKYRPASFVELTRRFAGRNFIGAVSALLYR